jgi:hypothetical protein
MKMGAACSPKGTSLLTDYRALYPGKRELFIRKIICFVLKI